MPSQSTDDLKLKERVQDICDRIAVGLPSLTGSGAIMQLITSYTDKKVREARIDEWKLIGETLHSANIKAGLHASKVKCDRIAQLKESEER